jgi:hypothetical protein
LEGRVKDWNTESAVYDGKAERCIEVDGEVNDGRAYCSLDEKYINTGRQYALQDELAWN